MHAAHDTTAGGSKVTKIMIVALFHVGLALAILGLKGPRQDNFTSPPPVVMIDEAPKPVEPDPVEPPDLSTQQMQPSQVVVPSLPIDVPPPVAPPLLNTVALENALPPPAQVQGSGTGQGDKVAPQPEQAKKTFSAALANASDCARPDYPARAVRNGEVGTVNLALLIGVDGKVTEAKVQKSSGSRELDRAAVSALSLCKFKPATHNGVAEPAWGQIAYVWTLD